MRLIKFLGCNKRVNLQQICNELMRNRVLLCIIKMDSNVDDAWLFMVVQGNRNTFRYNDTE